MKISIITACYNSNNNIECAINSILIQTYSNIEYIIIDGLSNDNTVNIIKEYEPKFNGHLYWVSEKDKGIYDALNKGIKMSSGEVIGLLHSDDLFASETTLENIAKTFEITGADIVYGDLEYVDKNDTRKIIRKWKSKPFVKEMLQKGWMPAHPTVFIKREVYQKHGLFDLNLKIAADYDLMLRIFSDDSLKFVYLPEVITKMRIGGESNKSIKNIIRKSTEDYLVMRKNKIKFPLVVLFRKNLSKIPQFFNR